MLTNEQLENNKKEFLSILDNYLGQENRGYVEELKHYLTFETDFFEAPASTKYHGNFKGGLCVHSLKVYKIMQELMQTSCITSNVAFSESSVAVVGLLHDVAKANYYEEYYANKKLYSENGSKKDNMGRFDWVSQQAYKVKEPQDRYTTGNYGFNSYMILSKFISLTDDEIVAIVNQYVGMDDGYSNKDMGTILNKNPLLVLLHVADMLSCYIVEKQ